MTKPNASSNAAPTTNDSWPELPLDAWADTYATLHRWTQIVAKTRLAFAPMQNHWWQVVLLPTSRGLVAPAMPIDDPAGPRGSRTLDVELDFIAHELVAKTSDGRVNDAARAA